MGRCTFVGPDKATRMAKEIADKNEEVFDDVTPAENIAKSVLIPDSITVKGNTLTAVIAKDKIGDIAKLNGAQVFLLGSEGYPNKGDTYNRAVNEFLHNGDSVEDLTMTETQMQWIYLEITRQWELTNQMKVYLNLQL